MKLFDAHCHLQDPRILSKAPNLIKTAQDSGVVHFVVNGVSEQDWHLVKDLAQNYPSIIPSFGLHPWSLSPFILIQFIIYSFNFVKKLTYLKVLGLMKLQVPSDRILLETDAPDALPMSNIDSLFFVEGDTSLPKELHDQITSSSTSTSLSNSSQVVIDASMLSKETLNHPANIRSVLDYVASMLEITKEELAELSYQNTVRLFSYEGSKLLQK
ncbi:hypothetical protein TanjilG_06077 [Lupinus angustifolius]|uniref:TatD related DNase n=1 Tax=Lupinus angustifolius TaxID=3871 RepID=A0A4P1RJU7_LUPAN|nr:hypothetical protein TanjilG_06077 [Lupinus angustifolius]